MLILIVQPIEGFFMAKKAPTATGVYLSRKDKARVEAVAEELDVTVHALMQWAIMDFIARYEAGEAKPRMQEQMVLIPYDEAKKSES